MKSCETFSHTADVGLAAQADDAEELFEALAEGLAEYICPRGSVRADETRPITAAGVDRESLAVDFLWRVMTVIQADRFMVARVHVLRLTDTLAQAELEGEPYDPRQHEIHTEVKAVTYHQLKIARQDNLWVGRVILDL